MDIDVKYFPFWKRYLNMFRESELTKMQTGQLLWMMMEYQFEDKEPETVPKALRMAWTFIRKDLDDARRCYEKNVKNGRKGGRKKRQASLDKPTENPDETQNKPERGISMSTSTTTSMSTSMSTSINTGSAPAGAAGVGGEQIAFGEFGWVKLTQQQYEKLEILMGSEELSRCITHIDELAQSTGNRNRWKDWYLMLRRCHDKQWHVTAQRNTKPEIPKGASGVLGEAELEAIQRVLRTKG